MAYELSFNFYENGGFISLNENNNLLVKVHINDIGKITKIILFEKFDEIDDIKLIVNQMDKRTIGRNKKFLISSFILGAIKKAKENNIEPLKYLKNFRFTMGGI